MNTHPGRRPFTSPLLLLGLVSILAGCTTYGYKTPIGENTYPPVDYHKVKLLFGAPDQPYDVIGIVSVQGGTWASAGDMYQKLIKSAAVLGADAVIVTGEGNEKMIIPGVSSTVGTATANSYGNTVDVYGNSTTTAATTTYASPTYIADLPTNKGLAIKFKQEPPDSTH